MSTRDLKWQVVRRRMDKLTERFVGPYKVKRVILLNVVELELLEVVKIHPVVNVSGIHRYKDQKESSISPTSSDRRRRGVQG